MAVLDIIRMGNPVLRKRARKLTLDEIRSTKIRKLVKDMVDTMRHVKGIGLAAPQVNHSLQMAVIEFDPTNPRYQNIIKSLPPQSLLILFNPKIRVLDERLRGYWEGCLSVPGIRGFVRRPKKIKIDYLDSRAEKQTIVAEGFLSTVFQHELDHLKGFLYLDHILLKDKNRLAFIEEFQQFWIPS